MWHALRIQKLADFGRRESAGREGCLAVNRLARPFAACRATGARRTAPRRALRPRRRPRAESRFAANGPCRSKCSLATQLSATPPAMTRFSCFVRRCSSLAIRSTASDSTDLNAGGQIGVPLFQQVIPAVAAGPPNSRSKRRLVIRDR